MINGSNVRLPNGQFSTYVTPVSKDGATQYVTPVGLDGNIIASVDLTAPTTNIGTVTPPAIIVSTLFRSANTGNVPFVAQPSGTGAFQLQPTDNTTVGGNARGANAVDLQTFRNAASQVASGLGSFSVGTSNVASANQSIAIGASNTASNNQSVAIGIANTSSGANASVALGNNNTASGSSSFAVGAINLASGNASIAMGVFASTKGINSLFALGNTIDNTSSKSQTNILGLGAMTADATPTILKSDTVGVAVSNQLTLQNNSAIAFTAVLTGAITGGGNTTSFQFQGCIKRGANAASTVLVGAVTPTLISRDAGAAAWTAGVTADTTNGCLSVTVTGQAATSIRWNCSIFATEVAF